MGGIMNRMNYYNLSKEEKFWYLLELQGVSLKLWQKAWISLLLKFD